ncbi:MAG: hypothetical protein HBSAPP03_22250 [Phycisphaerae bacterium]|nr:MAG: hypothetical protein HBSAPP03_22250 [Phycisphaerae bacterium]
MPDDATNPVESPRHSLTAADAAAIDALIDAGMNPAAVPETHRARANRARDLFNLLGTPTLDAGDDAALVDVTLARILRLAPAGYADEPELSPEDVEAMDAYFAAEQRLDRVPSVLRDRAARVEAVGRLAAAGEPAPHSAVLIERTLARVPVRTRIPQQSVKAVLGGFRLTDLVSVAAVLLISVSVLWPVLSTWRTHAQRSECGMNFASLASAFGLYSSDYRDQLPVATAGFSGGSWWNVGGGAGLSNSANLFRLPKLNYTSLKTLACPGNPTARGGPCQPTDDDWSCISEVSYSYQNMFAERRPSWGRGNATVILADGSPAIRNALAQRDWVPLQNSANHGGCGQWVLRTDGSGHWASTPVVDGDNIWLTDEQQQVVDQANARLRLMGLEVRSIRFFQTTPVSDHDSFLGP